MAQYYPQYATHRSSFFAHASDDNGKRVPDRDIPGRQDLRGKEAGMNTHYRYLILEGWEKFFPVDSLRSSNFFPE